MPTLSAELMPHYGRGFSIKSLARMVQFAEVFPEEGIVATLSRQLSWSHFVELIPLRRPLQREYYAEMCRIERWSVRHLRERVDSMLSTTRKGGTRLESKTSCVTVPFPSVGVGHAYGGNPLGSAAGTTA